MGLSLVGHRHVWGSFWFWSAKAACLLVILGYVLAQLVAYVGVPELMFRLLSPGANKLEGEFHNDTCQHQCLPGRMSTPKLLPPARKP